MSVLPIVFGFAFVAGMVVDLILMARRVRLRYREKVRIELDSLDSMTDELERSCAKDGASDEEHATIVGVREYVADARKRWKL